MTIFASDSIEMEGEARPPFAARPAFPAIVAAWFALLFGLGGLLLPVALLESVVPASGAVSLLPVLCGAGIGATAGFGLARRIARSHAANDDEEAGQSWRPPLNIREDVGETGFVAGHDPGEADAPPSPDEPGIEELVEQLFASLQARREAAAGPPLSAEPASDIATAEEAAGAMAEHFARPASWPAGGRPRRVEADHALRAALASLRKASGKAA